MKKPFNIDPKDKTTPCNRCHLSAEEGRHFKKNSRGFRCPVCIECEKRLWQETSSKHKEIRKRYNEMQRKRMEALYLISPAKTCKPPEGQEGQWMRYGVNLGSADGPVVIYCPEKGLEASLATTRKRMSEGMHKDTECTKFFVQTFIAKLSDPLGGGMQFNERAISGR